jgi:hypothetical protein
MVMGSQISERATFGVGGSSSLVEFILLLREVAEWQRVVVVRSHSPIRPS